MKFCIQWLGRPYPVETLAFFRVAFGGMMFVSMVRFFVNGWIEELYVKPEFYFSYYGLEWVKPFARPYLYAWFGLCALSALGIALGWFYRWASLLFFMTFTYIELMDKANYLNHYYLVSLLSFWMIFLPANRAYSLDVYRKPALYAAHVPYYMILLLKLQVVSVYFFGGLCKIKYDWLILAQPLKIWLRSCGHWWGLGGLFEKEWAAYVFSWGAMVMDLSLPFLLFHRRTRIYAFAVAIVFHTLTHLLFYIGMFPFIMTVSILIFFEPAFHRRVLQGLRLDFSHPAQASFGLAGPYYGKLLKVALPILVVLQVVLPFRFLLYPGNMLWTEEGFRFAWHIMVMEKAGFLEYRVREPATQKEWIEHPEKYLTKNQAKQLATQPDMILEFAHFLFDKYQKEGRYVEVYADSYCSLNGRPSQRYVHPKVNLAQERYSPFRPFTWIMPLNSPKSDRFAE